MRSKKKISLSFYNSSQFSDESDLNILLDESTYERQNKKIKEINIQISKPDTISKPDSQPKDNQQFDKFQRVYQLIQEMRLKKNAAVDIDGPHNLFDKNASINDQRFQILVALMLSPQTKDQITGQVMRKLLGLPCTIDRVSDLDEATLKQYVYDVNFNSTKTKRIINAAQKIKLQYNSVMPDTYDEIMKFEGVGEKIALLYIGVAFGNWIGIAVDVNIQRICARIPLTTAKSPARIRKQLEILVPKSEWQNFNQTTVGFGQQICRVPGQELCQICLIKKEGLCEYGQNFTESKKKKQRENSNLTKGDEDLF